MNKLPTSYGISAYDIESAVAVTVNDMLENDKDRALRALAKEAIKRANEMEATHPITEIIQRGIKDYDPEAMSGNLKNYIWDALEYEAEWRKENP